MKSASTVSTAETAAVQTPKTPQQSAPTGSETPRLYPRFDLLARFPWLKRIVKARSFQFLLVLPNVAVFYVFLLAAFFGSPVGNRNIIIVVVWILWWFLLITLMVPFLARVWCIVCPFPFFGEWMQRGRLIGVRAGKTKGLKNKMWGLNKRWPKKLSNIWLQNFLFLTMCTFSVALVTRPIVSAVALGGLFLAATILAPIYRQRAFCAYICPVSGFLGLYSMVSTIEIRARDTGVCKKCRSKACTVGSDEGWGCPWFQYLGKMDRNNYCGMCMECIKSCPNDNVSIFARPFAVDMQIRGYDESWKAFIMLALAMAYSVTLLGPYGTVKDWANIGEVRNFTGFFIYAGILWVSALFVLPAIWGVCTWVGRTWAGAGEVTFKSLFQSYSFMLVPLGLMAWIAFSLPLVMVNGSYIVSVISDPFGRGWDLFGTAHVPWTPILPEYAVHIQIVALAIGLYFALQRGWTLAGRLYTEKRQAIRSFTPMAAFCTLIALAFIKVYGG